MTLAPLKVRARKKRSFQRRERGPAPERILAAVRRLLFDGLRGGA